MSKHLLLFIESRTHSFITLALSVHLPFAWYLFIGDTNINKVSALSPEHSETETVDR